MPATNKLLLEANMTRLPLQPGVRLPAAGRHHQPDPGDRAVDDAGVHRRQSGAAASRLRGGQRGDAALGTDGQLRLPRARAVGLRGRRDQQLTPASASYVTGAHSMKVGYQRYWLRQLDQTIADRERSSPTAFNQGVPNAGHLPAARRGAVTRSRSCTASSPRTSYTRGRLTLSGAVRWDRASSYAPVERQRRARDVVPQPGADHHREDARRRRLQRHHARASASPTTCSATAGRR